MATVYGTYDRQNQSSLKHASKIYLLLKLQGTLLKEHVLVSSLFPKLST